VSSSVQARDSNERFMGIGTNVGGNPDDPFEQFRRNRSTNYKSAVCFFKKRNGSKATFGPRSQALVGAALAFILAMGGRLVTLAREYIVSRPAAKSVLRCCHLNVLL
jgi:hypothetical protein